MSIRSFTRRRGKCDASVCLLTSVFFCTLIAAASTDDVWIKCLGNTTNQPVQRHFLPAENVTDVTLEVSNRITHQLFTHIFRIILQEKLGYAQVRIVKYHDYDAFNITERMECVEQDEQNNAAEKVPTSMINVAVPVAPDFTDTLHCIKELGTIAPPEFFGWFIPTKYEPILRKWDRAWSNDSMNVQWSNFKDPKFAGKFQLTREDEKYLKDRKYLFNCMDAKCTNGKYIPDRCKDNTCATIVAPDFQSTQEVIAHIEEMRVYATVLWVGEHIETVVNYLTGRTASTGFLIMSWMPSDVVLDINKFYSVAMKRCDYTALVKSSGCFYEKRRLAKFAWKEIQTGKETPIFDTLDAMNLLDKKYLELLEFYSQNRKQKTMIEMACEWVQKNQKLINTEWLYLIEDFKIINIGGIFPITGSAYTGKGIVKGAQMAVKYINNAQILPPDMKLNLLVADGACRADKVMRAFIDYTSNEKISNLIGVLGPACSDTVEPLAGISKYFKTITISYSAEGGLFSDRDKYPYFLRTIGENQHYKHMYLKLFNALGWKRVAALTEDGQKYTEYISHMQSMLENEGIKFISNEKFPRERDKDAITKRLEKLKQDHARIIIADVFDEIARQVMCEAYKLEMTAKDGYVWFLPSWLNYTWYDTSYFNQQYNESVNCTTAIMKEAINGYFAMAHAYYGNDDDMMQENISIKQWKMKYSLDKHTNSTSNYSGYAYDAVWVYALALQKLLQQDPEAIDQLHSSNNTNKLVDIIKHLDFNGVSGQIKFRGGPTRFSVINVMQWYNGNTHIVSRFMPNISDSEGKIIGGELMLNKSAIVWLSNSQPADGPPAEQCTLHRLADFLNVSCQTALLITNIVCVLVFLGLLGGGIYYTLKRNYDKKMSNTNNYMKSLGLEHLLNSQYTGLDGWEVPKENVVLNRKLGEGAFGTVHGGEALLPDIGWTGVAVKTLKTGSTTEERLDFLSEAEVMKRFDHKNIVKLLGVCTKEEPVYTIMEFMLYGDLKTYLLARRHLVNCNDEYDEVSSKRLTCMALDVARGLSYLASLKYVHRDIASRNCLISEQRVVKLCDFGMTRPVANYYKFNRKGMLPVRWMAPESLALGVFTTASDVWSYGVLLYEIITFGSFPYQAMSNNEVLEAVKAGHSLSIPHGVKGPLEALLSKCWSRDQADRPAAADIVIYLAENPRLISPCLDVPISSVQTEDSGPMDMHMADNFRKVSSSTSFKNLPILVNDAERAASTNNQQACLSRQYAKRSVSDPDQCDSGISIQMENCCPKAPLLPPRSDSITEVLSSATKFAKATSPKRHVPMHESPTKPPPPPPHDELHKDYMPFEQVNGHAISKV